MPNETRILVLDDEISLLDTLTDFLRDSGYTVYPVMQPAEASAHLRCRLVDLAILDVGAHGLRIAREAMTNGVPTILMSGYPVIIEIGAVGEVLRKPFTLETLKANIEKAMAGRSRNGSAKAERAMDQLAPGRLPSSA
jgi:DNA-binding response OmpR family regulator